MLTLRSPAAPRAPGEGRARRLARRDAVLVAAPAKVNLFLEVRGRRADGYHEIATLMTAVSLFDTLELHPDPSGAITLECSLPDVPSGPGNLAYRAAALLKQRTGNGLGARVRLTKRIPPAAGLAGGSSDAAAALAGLNRLWGLGLAPAELAALGTELGSDVPFFFSTPAAWCTGRGEVVTPLELGRVLHFVLVCPPEGLGTAEVYRRVRVPQRPEQGGRLRAAAAAGDVEAIGRNLHNRLQEPAEEICPRVGEIRGRLGNTGAAGALMSGSGSCLFAVCRDRREAVRVAAEVRADPSPALAGCRVFVVRSCV